jgi:hypothetical protein
MRWAAKAGRVAASTSNREAVRQMRISFLLLSELPMFNSY